MTSNERTTTTARQLRRYASVGVANTALDFAVYSLLVLAGTWYVAAKVVAWSIATVNGYTLNRRWTFGAGAAEVRGLAKYVLVQGTGMAVNLVVLVALVELAGASPLVAQAIALPFAAGVTFLANKHWTFRLALAAPAQPEPDGEAQDGDQHPGARADERDPRVLVMVVPDGDLGD